MTDPQRLWSATTLISAGTPKDPLVGWAAKVTAERAFDKHATLTAFKEDNDRDGAIAWLGKARWDTSGKAMLRGTTVHGLIEAYALGQTPEVPEEVAPYDEQVRRFLDEHRPEFEAAEAPVYNLTLGYAGTMDMILNVGGKRCITDAKTTDKPLDARSRPPYGEVALQLAAYAHAEQVGVNPPEMNTFNSRRYYVYDPAGQYVPMPELDGALALVVSPYDYRLIPVRLDDEIWRAFLAVREVARWNLDVSKRVFGPVISAPEGVVA